MFENDLKMNETLTIEVKITIINMTYVHLKLNVLWFWYIERVIKFYQNIYLLLESKPLALFL